jgi:hypothetical protein
MIVRNLRILMNSKGDPKGAEQEEGESNKKDPYGSMYVECSGYSHIQEDCGNLK